jgi:hypothetical protein
MAGQPGGNTLQRGRVAGGPIPHGRLAWYHRKSQAMVNAIILQVSRNNNGPIFLLRFKRIPLEHFLFR